jgi:octaprenyl-diphosphate synthase
MTKASPIRWANTGAGSAAPPRPIDDLLDYSRLTTIIGKSVGDDFRDKLTLPVLYAREALDARDRKFWDRVMGDASSMKATSRTPFI